MLVTIALMALLNAGPVCKALCDPDPACAALCGTQSSDKRRQELEACIAQHKEDLKTVEVVDGALAVAAGLANRVVACEAKLNACEAKRCPLPKKIGKKIGKKAVVVVPAAQKQEQKQEQHQEVIIQITSSEPRVFTVVRPAPEDAFPLGIGVRGAVGLTCNPIVFGVLGVRARLLPAHLGLEVNTQFAYGHSAQLMVYPIQGKIAWHLDFGGLLFPRNGPQLNLLAGTGVEVQVVPHFSITADWRMTMPKAFNVGDSLLKSQLMLGLMLHTW